MGKLAALKRAYLYKKREKSAINTWKAMKKGKKSMIGSDFSKYKMDLNKNPKLRAKYKSKSDIARSIGEMVTKRRQKVSKAFSKPTFDLNS